MHVYLEREVVLEGGRGKPLGVLNWRGESGPGDDPNSYKRLMEAKGLRVHLSPTFLGKIVAVEDLPQEA